MKSLLITLLSVTATCISAHPQCLDFRPPFELSEPLTFCSEYASLGCCTRERDAEIRAEFEELLQQQQQQGDCTPASCNNYTKTLMCQECSPYAAHLFDTEADRSQGRNTPGLCRNYCEEYYDQCISQQTCSAEPLPSKQDFCTDQEISDMNYCYPELLTNAVLNGDIMREAITSDGCLCLEPFTSGLRNPLVFRAPKDRTGRIFIAEQVGVVYALYKNGSRVSNVPFLDISNNVLITANAGDERGFLGLEFHPNFLTNGKLYIFYSVRVNGQHNTRVSEISAGSYLADEVDYTTERILIQLPQPFSNHNGGEV